MKMACVGPLGPFRSGVAQFSENLLPFLAERCDIVLFSDPYPPSETPTLSKFEIAPISKLTQEAEKFDAILYHMGNHYRYHRRVFEALWRIPGIALFHDCVLNHFFAKFALERGNFETFRRLFEFCYGEGDNVLKFYKGRGDPYAFPMAGVVAVRSRGAIVMSEYGAGIVRAEAQGAKVLKVNFPYLLPQSEVSRAVRKIGRLEVDPDAFVVSSIGHMTSAKRVDIAIEAFSRFTTKFPNSIFLLAGETAPSFPIREVLARQTAQNIHFLDYLEDSELDALLCRADAFINLRYPSNGEMSAALMQMLGRGKPVVVSNYAQFAELPDAACLKLDIGSGEIDNLAEMLLELARDEGRRRSIGKAARDYVAQHHTCGKAADAIVSFAMENSASEPPLSADMAKGMLLPDGLLKRYPRMAVYNGRRLLGRSMEQGLITTARQVFWKAFARTS
jgi:glycosyltransferase involved in cell wall biosynthesis